MLVIQILIILTCSSFCSNMNVIIFLWFLSIILALALFWISVLYFLWFCKCWLAIAYYLCFVWFFWPFFFVLGIIICVPKLTFILFFSFEVILSKVAVLTEPIRVMGFIRMITSTCHFWFAFSVIAVVTHVLCVMLFVQMVAQKHIFFPLCRYIRFAHTHRSILLVKSLHLKASHSIVFKMILILFKLRILYLLLVHLFL